MTNQYRTANKPRRLWGAPAHSLQHLTLTLNSSVKYSCLVVVCDLGSHFLGLTETWLNPSKKTMAHLTGYTAYMAQTVPVIHACVYHSPSLRLPRNKSLRENSTSNLNISDCEITTLRLHDTIPQHLLKHKTA